MGWESVKRWTGKRWTSAAYSLDPDRLRVAERFDDQNQVDATTRRRALSLAVEDQVATQRAEVVFDGPSGIVLAYRRRVSHFVHAVLTVLTAGLWAPFWLASALGRREDRVRLEVDRWGNVWPKPIPGA